MASATAGSAECCNSESWASMSLMTPHQMGCRRADGNAATALFARHRPESSPSEPSPAFGQAMALTSHVTNGFIPSS
jgi:hypothetical protein